MTTAPPMQANRLGLLAERIGALSREQRRAFLEKLEERGIDVRTLPITKRNRGARSPLSSAQQRLWAIDRVDPGSSLYVLPSVLKLFGSLDAAALERALAALVARHEVLRTTFLETDGEPQQVVHEPAPVAVEVLDLTALPAEERSLRAWQVAEQEAATGFDLERGPLFRARLLRLDAQEHWLLVSMHHIICDEWSDGILGGEFIELYNSARAGRAPSLRELPIQYADYSLWQRDVLMDVALSKELAYWKAQLEGGGEDYTLTLPTDFPRPSTRSHRGGVHTFAVGPELVEALGAFGRSRGLTAFMTVLGTFQFLLSRYSGQSDIRVGVPIANRNRKEIEGLIGFFVNTQVLRTLVRGAEPVASYFERVRAAAVGAQSNQDLPFEQLVEALKPERRLQDTPLFQVMFSWHRDEVPRSAELDGLRVVVERQAERTAKFDLTLHMTETSNGLEGQFIYRADLFRPRTIEKMAERLVHVLREVLDKPNRRIVDLDWLQPADRPLETRCHPRRDAWQRGGIHGWISQCASQRAGASAIRCEETELSYAELEARANRLAEGLQRQGVGRGDRVALCLPRSVEFVVGLYAVLKVGAVYVPLDPKQPPFRLRELLADSDVRLLLTEASMASHLGALGVDFRLSSEMEAQGSGAVVNEPVAEHAPAYVIYTSGSTGRPKGVEVTHGGLMSYVRSLLERVSIGEGASMAMVSTVAADLGNTVLFGALCSGGTLHLISEERAFDPDGVGEYVARHGVEVMKIVPSHLKGLMQARHPERVLPRRALILGGEATSWELVEAIRKAGQCRIINHYGPTETTVGALTYELADEKPESESLPLGRALGNSRVLVLNGDLQVVPAGVVGEIYIGGQGVANGYLNRAELTAERFIPDVYEEGGGGRLYRTGDRGRYLEDGSIEFLGRQDHQVKIRGYRVELGEVANALRSVEGILDAEVLLTAGQAGNPRLVAYVIGAAGERDAERASARLRERLPDHMVPNHYVWLESFPVTANGKLDRAALPEPGAAAPPAAKVAPRTELEKKLATIWCDVLKIEDVGVHDNFFKLGGDSILALQVVARARRAGLKLTPKQLFTKQSLAEAAAAAVLLSSPPERPAAVDDTSGEVPLTPVQRWFFEQEFVEAYHFNQSVLLELSEPLDLALLEKAVELLVSHHDAFRLRYRREAGGWKQSYAEARPGSVWHVDLKGALELETAIEAVGNDAQRSLSLEDGPLLRVAHVVLGGGRPNRLLLVIHHLLVDGVSWRIVLEDLRTLYTQLKAGETANLGPKTTSFKSWAEALQRYACSDDLRRELRFWESIVGGPAAPLPAVDRRGRNTVALARTLGAELDESETTRLLTQAHAAYRTRVDELLLAALARALCRWAGRESVLVELEGHGREDLFEELDVSRTVGWFTTLCPAKLEPGSGGLGRSIMAVKEQLRAIPNKGIGYGALRYLSPEGGSLSRGAAPDVTFNYLGQFDQVFEANPLFRVAAESAGNGRAPDTARRTALEILTWVAGQRLQIGFTYGSEVLDRAEVERLQALFVAELRGVIEHCTDGDAGGVTPSDFPLAGLLQSELDGLGVAPRRIEDVYPLSPMQEGMLFHSLLAPESGVYVNQRSCEIHHALDVAALKRAWRRVLAAHDVLRSGFVWQGLRRAQQIVHLDVELPFEVLDWSGRAANERDADFARYLEQDRRRGFDLARPPLMRVALLRLAEDRYRFVWTEHHLLLDGWSSGALLTELFQQYFAVTEGGSEPIRRPARYRDYIAWLERQDRRSADEFFRKELAGFESPTLLHRPATSRAPEAGRGTLSRLLPSTQSAELDAYARARGVTLNTVFQGALAVLLGAYTRERDVVFGVTVSGRNAEIPNLDHMLGLFINTLPLRVMLDAALPVAEWLQALQTRNGALREYSHAPLVEVQRHAAVAHGQALFDTLLVFENYPVDRALGLSADALGVTDVQAVQRTSYPLTILVSPGSEISIELEYDGQYFDAADAGRILADLEAILLGLVAKPGARLRDLAGFVSERYRGLLEHWNDTQREYPSERVLHELIEAQVERSPTHPAVLFGTETLSYRELDRRANHLAQALVELGVGPEVFVGLYLERSLEMVVALLAVLKAGGAYVPLDPDYPTERIAYVLCDARPRVVLTEQRMLARLAVTDAVVHCLDSAPAVITGERSAPGNLERRARPQNLAYCLYTSGSTGKPKGVGVSHRALVNFLWTMRERPGFTADDRTLALTSLSFDIAALELYLPLLVGGSLALVDRATAMDPDRLLSEMDRHRVTFVQATPATWRMLSESPRFAMANRTVLCGGEALPGDLAKRLVEAAGSAKPGSSNVWNVYGPTETTVWSTRHEIDPRSAEPLLGHPIGNTDVYLLDDALRPVPIGVVGELYIGGAGLARGYVNRPDLTAQRFVPDPFGDGARLYRTGDLARYRTNGALEYVGRSDHQVKIRGFRIELGEIEACLRRLDEVRDAAVTARDGASGDKELVAYVVPSANTVRVAPEEPAFRETLRRALSAELPAYMLPVTYVFLDELPLTANGKIDRKALPAPDRASVQKPHRPPRTELEAELVEIWQRLLGTAPIGIDDDFFELGGNSILAVRLMDSIRRTKQIAVPLRLLFERPTVESLACALADEPANDEGKTLVVLAPGAGRTPLFCVHPAGGHVLAYGPLSGRLRGVRPVYGIQARSFYRDEWIDGSLETMAEHYASEIERVQPSGPIQLLGWSFGAAMAVEVARVWQRRGGSVEFLGLIDPTGILGAELRDDGAAEPANPGHERRLQEWIDASPMKLKWRRLLALADRDVYRWLLAQFIQFPFGDERMDVVEESQLFNAVNCLILMRDYQLQPLAVRTHVWWARESTRRESWAALERALDERLFVGARTIVEGDHESIVHSEELAGSVAVHLERAGASSEDRAAGKPGPRV